MNSRFKFPRRVRIHGGECGAVARALHHKVKGSTLCQADSGKALGSTNERKQMSTKTTLKRIALVAVSALGFGLLSTVPARAAGDVTPTAVSAGTVATAAVGVANDNTITVTHPAADAAGSDTFIVGVRVLSAPAGSAFAGLASASKTIAGATATGFEAATYATGQTVGALIAIANASSTSTSITSTNYGQADYMTVAAEFTSGPTTAASVVAGSRTSSLKISVTPDVPGTYTVLVHTEVGGGDISNGTVASRVGAFSSGDASMQYSFSTGGNIASGGSITLTSHNATSIEDSVYGSLIKVTVKDSAGAASGLVPGQTITVTTNDTTNAQVGQATSTTNALCTGFGTSTVLDSADFLSGNAYVCVKSSAANTGLAVTATGGGTLSNTVTGSTTLVFKAASTALAASAVSITDVDTKTEAGGGAALMVAGSPSTVSVSTGATSFSFQVNATVSADSIFDLQVTDTSGGITGRAGAVYSIPVAIDADDDEATVTITGALAVAGRNFTAALNTADGYAAADSVRFTSATAAATDWVEDFTSVYLNHGASVTLGATLYDQFGAVMSGVAGTIATTGRNASSVDTNFTTDTNGRVTFTRTDAGTAATSATTSTVTFTATTASLATSFSLTYGTDKVSTVTITSGTEDDTATSITYRDISTSATGAQAGAANITATVKDANGSVLAGVPVTWAISGGGAAVLSTHVTTYTNSNGIATSKIYAWTEGTKTVTATAGTKTDTDTVNYRQGGSSLTAGATEVRAISAVISGASLVVTAKDRFGNVVPGVALYMTRTGNGTFGGGTATATGTTDRTGTLEVVFNAGSEASVVTVYAGTSANDPGYGQTSSKSGFVCTGTDCTATAVTAAVAGTSTTAEKGVGDTLAAAGVNSVKVNVAAAVNTAQVAAEAATDAAAEAIDAANAATDAANLAAEAADAATVAAEEARDAADAATAAVEELATQVATLMAALKAQITTLANTVAKIAKKVRA
jgi:hypothetical protein